MDGLTVLFIVAAVAIVCTSGGGLIGYAIAIKNAKHEQENYRN